MPTGYPGPDWVTLQGRSSSGCFSEPEYQILGFEEAALPLSQNLKRRIEHQFDVQKRRRMTPVTLANDPRKDSHAFPIGTYTESSSPVALLQSPLDFRPNRIPSKDRSGTREERGTNEDVNLMENSMSAITRSALDKMMSSAVKPSNKKVLFPMSIRARKPRNYPTKLQGANGLCNSSDEFQSSNSTFVESSTRTPNVKRKRRKTVTSLQASIDEEKRKSASPFKAPKSLPAIPAQRDIIVISDAEEESPVNHQPLTLLTLDGSLDIPTAANLHQFPDIAQLQKGKNSVDHPPAFKLPLPRRKNLTQRSSTETISHRLPEVASNLSAFSIHLARNQDSCPSHTSLLPQEPTSLDTSNLMKALEFSPRQSQDDHSSYKHPTSSVTNDSKPIFPPSIQSVQRKQHNRHLLKSTSPLLGTSTNNVIDLTLDDSDVETAFPVESYHFKSLAGKNPLDATVPSSSFLKLRSLRKEDRVKQLYPWKFSAPDLLTHSILPSSDISEKIRERVSLDPDRCFVDNNCPAKIIEVMKKTVGDDTQSCYSTSSERCSLVTSCEPSTAIGLTHRVARKTTIGPPVLIGLQKNIVRKLSPSIVMADPIIAAKPSRKIFLPLPSTENFNSDPDNAAILPSNVSNKIKCRCCKPGAGCPCANSFHDQTILTDRLFLSGDHLEYVEAPSSQMLSTCLEFEPFHVPVGSSGSLSFQKPEKLGYDTYIQPEGSISGNSLEISDSSSVQINITRSESEVASCSFVTQDKKPMPNVNNPEAAYFLSALRSPVHRLDPFINSNDSDDNFLLLKERIRSSRSSSCDTGSSHVDNNSVRRTVVESRPVSASPDSQLPVLVKSFGGIQSITWKTCRQDLRNFNLKCYYSKHLPHTLHDHINQWEKTLQCQPTLVSVFQSAVLENTADDEPDAPVIEVINQVDDEPTPLWEFYYTNYMWHGDGVPPPDINVLKGCNCRGRCDPKSKNCTCIQRQRQYTAEVTPDFAYDSRGRLKTLDVLDYPIFECNVLCGCDENCRNRVVQYGRKVTVNIQKTCHKGWGVFAGNKKIPAGTFIGIYSGELLTDAIGEMRGIKYNKFGRTYLFDLDFYYLRDGNEDWQVKYTVDAYHAGNFTRFLNHSCDPNCQLVPCYINEANIEKPLLTVFALRDIDSFEEICFSYSGPYNDEDEIQNLMDIKNLGGMSETEAVYAPCACKARNCKGKLFM